MTPILHTKPIQQDIMALFILWISTLLILCYFVSLLIIMQELKKDIRLLSLKELESFFIEKGDKSFRAKQVFEWLWVKSSVDFEEMSNLSKVTRDMLSAYFVINDVKVGESQVSKDKTIKSSFVLHDGNIVEGVLIPTSKRMTACVSSQVGCSLSCSFCATGYMDRKRNLDAAEIYDQVVQINTQAIDNYGIPLSNIVYMGMGEPLLNYSSVLKSIEHLTSEKGLGMSPKRITVSTAGIAKMIKKLGDDEVRFGLALSLHAANDTKRNKIMPINESNQLDVLTDALKYFYDKTGTLVIFEYIVFKDFNDGIEDALELYDFWKKVPAKINIIEYNPIEQGGLVNTTEDKLEAFKNILEDKGVIVNVRRSRGKDIDAACGQLAGKNNS